MSRPTNRQTMRMVFFCAKGYQSDLVECQVTDKDRAREQRDLDRIERLEKLIMGRKTPLLPQQLQKEGCVALTVAEIKKTIGYE